MSLCQVSLCQVSRRICCYGECRHAEGRYGEFRVSMRLRRSHLPDLTSPVLKSDQKIVRIDSFHFLEIFSVLNLSPKIEKIFFFLRLWSEKFHLKSLKQRWPVRFCRLLFEFGVGIHKMSYDNLTINMIVTVGLFKFRVCIHKTPYDNVRIIIIVTVP